MLIFDKTSLLKFARQSFLNFTKLDKSFSIYITIICFNANEKLSTKVASYFSLCHYMKNWGSEKPWRYGVCTQGILCVWFNLVLNLQRQELTNRTSGLIYLLTKLYFCGGKWNYLVLFAEKNCLWCERLDPGQALQAVLALLLTPHFTPLNSGEVRAVSYWCATDKSLQWELTELKAVCQDLENKRQDF